MQTERLLVVKKIRLGRFLYWLPSVLVGKSRRAREKPIPVSL